jgi:predicted small integral membrane protein
MAFLVALVIIVGGIWLIYKGKQWEGLVAVLTPLATLVGVFIYSTAAAHDG